MVTADRELGRRRKAEGFTVISVTLIFSTALAAGTLPVDRLETLSVLMLPLVGLTGQDARDLGANLSAEISLLLAKSDGLHIVSPLPGVELQSSDVREMGETQKAAVVIAGSVRFRDEELRVDIQAIRVSNGHHIWSQSYTHAAVRRSELAPAIALDIIEALNKWRVDT